MNQTSGDLTAVLAPLWARKWLILAIAVIAAGGTYAWFDRQPRVFQSGTEIFLGTEGVTELVTGQSTFGLELTEKDLANQATIIRSPAVSRLAAQELGGSLSISQLQGSIAVGARGGADVLSITATAGSPQLAARIANAYAEAYQDFRRAEFEARIDRAVGQLQARLERVTGSGTEARGQRRTFRERIRSLRTTREIGAPVAPQLQPARANAQPLAPNPGRNAVFAFVLGLLAAAILAYALQQAQLRRLTSVADVERVFGQPVVSSMPEAPRSRRARRAADPAITESLRWIHTSLLLHGAGENGDRHAIRTVLVTSGGIGDGKSTVVEHLARAQAAAGLRVVVVDADLRRPTQADRLDVEASPGLSELLGQQGRLLDEVLRQVDVGADADAEGAIALEGGELWVLPSGSPARNPPALLGEQAVRRLLDDLEQRFDSVLIDCPPLPAVADAMPFLRSVDGVLLVARVGHSSQSAIARMQAVLDDLPRPPYLGVVANGVPAKELVQYEYGRS